MIESQLNFISVGLRKRGASIKLRLRWDRSPHTCASIVKRLPIEAQVWHAKSAGCELYTLIPVTNEKFVGEWRNLNPGAGDLMYLPIEPGFGLPPGAPSMDLSKGLIDIAYFYDRGNNLVVPTGIALGNIFATAILMDDVESMAKACNDVWFRGAVDEQLFVEAAKQA